MTAGVRLDDETSIPRSNGELVFEQPWESTAFGIVVGLCEEGAFEWEFFRSELVSQIAEHRTTPYYVNWLRALQRVLAETGLLASTDIDARSADIATEFVHEHHHHDADYTGNESL